MAIQDQLETYIVERRPHFEDLLGQMVEVPSISMDPSKANDMRRMADMAAQVLAGMGAESRIIETGGYPIVSGGWTAGAQYPSVTIYNHLGCSAGSGARMAAGAVRLQM